MTQHDYYMANREKLIEVNKERYLKKKEEMKEYQKNYQDAHKQEHTERQKKYKKRVTARSNFLIKMYKEMAMWVYVYESKDEEMLSEREKILLEEYKKTIDIIENCEELGVKKLW